LNLHVGCSGWSYKEWNGTLYPIHLENKNWLSFYSRFFKFFEADLTFFNIPSRFIVKGWKDKTPRDFKFVLKFPKIISHNKKLQDISKDLHTFFVTLMPLIDKDLIR
jgi:uncharacterized protein YecE (DUF72 family)